MPAITAQAKILRSDAALLAALEDAFYHDNGDPALDPPTAVNGGIILPLSLKPAVGGYTAQVPGLILEPEEIRCQLQFTESGGAPPNGGQACCWCGPTGERLYAYYLPAGKRCYPCGSHAYFAIGKAVLSLEAEWDNGYDHPDDAVVNVTRHSLSLNWPTRQLMVYVDHLWNGHPDMLPRELRRLQTAVRAAVAKAHCRDCCEAHFAKMAKAKVVTS